jgi:ferredoxin
VPECPAGAIYTEDDLPEDQHQFIAINAELAKKWKPIVARKDAPADADEWLNVKDKLKFLKR